MSAATTPRPTRSPSTQTKRMSLSAITDEGRTLPSRTVIHGEPGTGKTSLSVYFQNPVVLMSKGETGLLTLMQSGAIPKTNHFPEQANNWQDVLDAIDSLMGEHTYKTLVIDTLNGVERLCHEHTCERDYGGDWGERGFAGYQRGFETSINDWRGFLFALDKLRETKGMGIVLLCHTSVRSIRNPMAADYDCFIPALAKPTWNTTVGWADIVLFCKKQIYVKEEKGKTSHHKAVAGERVILTEGNAAYEAKNRHRLPPEISMGNSGEEAFKNLMEGMKAGRAAATPEKGGDKS